MKRVSTNIQNLFQLTPPSGVFYFKIHSHEQGVEEIGTFPRSLLVRRLLLKVDLLLVVHGFAAYRLKVRHDLLEKVLALDKDLVRLDKFLQLHGALGFKISVLLVFDRRGVVGEGLRCC